MECIGYARGYEDGRQGVKVEVSRLTSDAYMQGYRDGLADLRQTWAGKPESKAKPFTWLHYEESMGRVRR